MRTRSITFVVCGGSANPGRSQVGKTEFINQIIGAKPKTPLPYKGTDVTMAETIINIDTPSYDQVKLLIYKEHPQRSGKPTYFAHASAAFVIFEGHKNSTPMETFELVNHIKFVHNHLPMPPHKAGLIYLIASKQDLPKDNPEIMKSISELIEALKKRRPNVSATKNYH